MDWDLLELHFPNGQSATSLPQSLSLHAPGQEREKRDHGLAWTRVFRNLGHDKEYATRRGGLSWILTVRLSVGRDSENEVGQLD